MDRPRAQMRHRTSSREMAAFPDRTGPICLTSSSLTSTAARVMITKWSSRRGTLSEPAEYSFEFTPILRNLFYYS